MSSTPSQSRVRTIALIVACALFMEQLDATVLATALPSMARSFGVRPLHMSIALTAYLLSLAVFIPASGTIADRFGTKRVFNAAIIFFTLGSILCSQTTSLPLLVAARLIQGMGGAMMVPVGRIILLRSAPKSELVSAMAWFLVPALVGPVVGPPLGGFITTYLSWRWIFFINIPIGILGCILSTLLIPDIRSDQRTRFDLPGFVLSGLALACLTFGFTVASRGTEWTTAVPLLVIGTLAGTAYVIYARRRTNAILDLRLMRVQTFRISTIAGSLSRITWGSVPFLLPMMMQLGFGMTAAASGAITFMAAAGAMLMKFTAGPLLKRFGFRRVLIWNQLLATLGIAACAAFTPGWPRAAIFTVLLAAGFFQSLQFTAYNTIAYADLKPDRMSAATSFYTVFQQLMLSMGICVAAGTLALSAHIFGHHEPDLLDFRVAFIVVSIASLFAGPLCAKLPPSAGEEMSGHHSRPAPAKA
ncbi:DHA2 family efflux MFS transporter permease subunit [Acidisoma silvae]|uniref:DHA2 family efflux MFS transporter permease subunit n=1 Tax=Acidisoma silvae TaxID=2802396 RepID=UPI001D09E31D|nr:DHA2 family efflux MFS transporter permease subunit [Acidisoma silvae]